MAFLIDSQELKPGLIIFRRSDVKHQNWYCRIKVLGESRYKTVSLGTSDINQAKDKAFDHDADVRFRIRHNVPVFEKSFADVATEYSEQRKRAALAGQITMRRWKTVDGHVRLHLVPYLGNTHITRISEYAWSDYPFWRRENPGTKIENTPGPRRAVVEQPAQDAPEAHAKAGTIRQEMMTFRAVMSYAARKQYIRDSQIPRGRLPKDDARREEFTPQEYRKLHTFARRWIKEGRTDSGVWYRTMAYNFMLIMTNTGMRTMEARNLRWRDVDQRRDSQGRLFACVNVRGKGKFRELVAAESVMAYLGRIRAISKATKPDDFVFTTESGAGSKSLYDSVIASLLKESGLLFSSSGSRRSSYCFRHTFATFRLMEGVDIYFLAKQMGTSVKMIEDYYGHITPAQNAERILQGMPGWEPIKEKNSQAMTAAA